MRRLLAFVVPGVIVGCCAVALTATGATSLLWNGDFTPEHDNWTDVQARPGGFAVVPAPGGRSGLAAQFTVHPGDTPAGSGGERAEIYKRTGEQEGVESYWTWSVYFPSTFASNPNTSWNVFTQWHQGSNTGVQPVSFEVNNTGSKEFLRLRVWGGDPEHPTRRAWQLAPLVRGHWYDFSFHVVWSGSKRGLVELWLDGRRVIKPTATPTLYTGDDVYLKQGFYRAASSLDTTVVIAGTRRLSSFDGLRTRLRVARDGRVGD